MTIYNVLGQVIAELLNEYKEVGEHTVLWDGTNSKGRPVATGVYFYRLKAEGKLMTRKMVLVR